MLPGMRQEWVVERERQLRLAAERHRLLQEAPPRPRPRERLGRILIALGARLAGDQPGLFVTPR